MKKFVSTLLFALIVGMAAAFFRPMAPHQIETVPMSATSLFPARGGAETPADIGLDNPDIAEDQNINPSRKCGFCMGVSIHFEQSCATLSIIYLLGDV